jgi:hypothetical protein
MKTVLALIALVGLISVPLMAQDYPKSEVFGGYQYLHLGGISSGGVTSDGQSFNGWNASLTGNFSKHFGVAGDFGGGYAWGWLRNDQRGFPPTFIHTRAGRWFR